MAILAINLQDRFFSRNTPTVLPIAIFSNNSVLSDSFLLVLLFDIKLCVRFLIMSLSEKCSIQFIFSIHFSVTIFLRQAQLLKVDQPILII